MVYIAVFYVLPHNGGTRAAVEERMGALNAVSLGQGVWIFESDSSALDLYLQLRVPLTEAENERLTVAEITGNAFGSYFDLRTDVERAKKIAGMMFRAGRALKANA